MFFHRFRFIVLICMVFLATSIVFFGGTADKEKETATPPELVDKVLDLLMGLESIPRGNYEHYDISPDGRFVAFSIERGFKEKDLQKMTDWRRPFIPSTLPRNDIWVASIETGELKRITNGKIGMHSYWHPAWAPNSRDLAFYGDKEGRVMLWLCRNAVEVHPEIRAVKGINIKAGVFVWDIPRWTKDGKRLIIPIASKIEGGVRPKVERGPLTLIPSLYQKFLDPAGGSTVSVLRWPKETESSQQPKSTSSFGLSVLEVKSGKILNLTSGRNAYTWELSPDNQMIAFKVFKRKIPETYGRAFDLYVTSLESTRPRLLLEETTLMDILWSSDSRLLLERKNGELVTVNVQNGEKKVITESIDSSFDEVRFRNRNTLGKILWSPKGDKVIARNKEGWWLLSLNGSHPKKLFREMNGGVSGILMSIGKGNAFSPDGHSMVLETSDPKSGKISLAKADLDSNRIEQISKDVPKYSQLLEISRKKDNNVIVYSVCEQGVTDLWVSDLSFSKKTKITNLNSHFKQIPQAKKMFITYRNLKGQELEGSLLLPPDFKEGKRYPLVANVHAGIIVSSKGNVRPISFNPVSSLSQLLSSCGYIVLRPSIPMSLWKQKGSTLRDIPESVLPAINKVIDMGIADPDRIGVIGQSYGGYSVNVLITQTKRFKAAVSMASISDLINQYGAFGGRERYTKNEPGLSADWAEGGQGRMGVPLWEDRLQYIENSPIFYLDKVETPLLLIHGDLDFISMSQPEEMYSGLKRLNKTVEFARYWGEGHVFSKPANIRDSWHRIVAWFEKYLKTQ